MPLDLGLMDFSTPPHVGEASAYTTEPMQRPLATAAVGPTGAGLGLGTPDRSWDDTDGDVATRSRSGMTPLTTLVDRVVLPQVKRTKSCFRRASKIADSDSGILDQSAC